MTQVFSPQEVATLAEEMAKDHDLNAIAQTAVSVEELSQLEGPAPLSVGDEGGMQVENYADPMDTFIPNIPDSTTG